MLSINRHSNDRSEDFWFPIDLIYPFVSAVQYVPAPVRAIQVPLAVFPLLSLLVGMRRVFTRHTIDQLHAPLRWYLTQPFPLILLCNRRNMVLQAFSGRCRIIDADHPRYLGHRFDNRQFALRVMSLPSAEPGVRGDSASNPTRNSLVSTLRDAIVEIRMVPTASSMLFYLPSKVVEPQDIRAFPAFVTALYGHEHVEILQFHYFPFKDGSNVYAPRYDDLERLFGTVLPNLPRLTYLSFVECDLHPRCAELFFAALPDDRRPLLELDFFHNPLTPGVCRALAGALRRDLLSTLDINNAKLDSESATILVQAAAASRHLQRIYLVDKDRTWTVTPATWAGGAMVRATMPSFTFGDGWTDPGLVELFWQLRLNVSLRGLDVRGSVSDQRMVELLEELLSAYNFTIEDVGSDYDRRPRIEALLRRNERVRAANDRLQMHNYHVRERNLWPSALRVIGAFPTLVYRFLRHGNAVALSDQLRSKSRGKRRSADT